jgi:hypothetical protein
MSGGGFGLVLDIFIALEIFMLASHNVILPLEKHCRFMYYINNGVFHPRNLIRRMQ